MNLKCPFCGGENLVLEFGTRGRQCLYQAAGQPGWHPADHEVIGHNKVGDAFCEDCDHQWRTRVPDPGEEQQ